jgi:trehalose synthase
MAEIVSLDPPAGRPAAADPVVDAARRALEGRTVWHVNSTAVGGGVAELLRSAVPRHVRAGIDARWLVTGGDEQFFALTKQLHHRLHGSPGDTRPLTAEHLAAYTRTTGAEADEALAHMRPGDVVVLHDPQTLGLAPALRAAGLRVAWRSHIGTASPGPEVLEAWDFLAPFLPAPQRLVFSLPDYVPPALDRHRTTVIAPSIDETDEKCRPMSSDETRRVLADIGLTTQAADPPGATAYAARGVTVRQDEPLPADAPVLLQLARWDPLKDMAGVLEAFARHIAPAGDAHLVLAGPDPSDIADDPENLAVFDAVLRAWKASTPQVRRRVHLVALRLADDDAELRANAHVVNALQRHATVIAQKSIEEGFGLAVAEAMWKSRPVVASAVGGIGAQVTHEVNGLLVDDPADLAAFGQAVLRLLTDRPLRERLGSAAHTSCARRYTAQREFRDHARLYLDLCGVPAPDERTP